MKTEVLWRLTDEKKKKKGKKKKKEIMLHTKGIREQEERKTEEIPR